MDQTLATSTTLAIVVAAGSIILLFCIIRSVRRKRCKTVACYVKKQETPTGVAKRNYWHSLRRESIIVHKNLLTELVYAANRCCSTAYALRCIDIVGCCPQLMNVRIAPSGLTVFHRVCYYGHCCLIEFMLKKGADPFITTATGEDALCMAVYYLLNNPMVEDFSCVELLERAGCRLHVDNEWYNVFLEQARIANHTRLAKWLIIHCKTLSLNGKRCASVPPKLKHYLPKK